MRPEQWQTFKSIAKRQLRSQVPVSLIVDSPWMPGYLGLGHFDYYFNPEVWLRANLQIHEEFPEVIFFPSWWFEYGMGAEASAFGSRLHFYSDQTPAQTPILFHLEDLTHLKEVNPRTDGLMSAVLHHYRTQRQRIKDAGYTIPVATARGPLCVAAFLRGLEPFLMDLAEDPAGAHRLLEVTTTAIIRWLEAQAEAIGGSVEGIFLLDDIVGFLSRKRYLEFADPYLRRIFAAFPADWVKVYHNDANVRPFLRELSQTGFDVLNWTHLIDVKEARAAAEDRLCLMGNVAPLDLGVRGSYTEVKEAALQVLTQGGGQGQILSVGGGVSPGMPKENILALCEAAREYSSTLPGT